MNNMIDISTSGMTANKTWLEVTSNNLANINTTRTEVGGPYQRQTISMSERAKFESTLGGIREAQSGVEVSGVYHDRNVRIVYDPEHPDANEEGYVSFPEINITAEMTNLLMAQRGYEINSTVFNTAKQMAERTLSIGK